ncbi:MAG: hypothetical protein NUV86_00945 [Candidatus Scalindua sp.]|nr:hypothetical protein [Candidatus Scalindua sp.]MCR4343157.1 hypothetical protein [Candidatus Scalindua sp.]
MVQLPASNIFDTTLWLNALSSVLNSDIRILEVLYGRVGGNIYFTLIRCHLTGIQLFKDKGFEYYDLGEAGRLSKANFNGEFYTDLVPYYLASKSNSLFSIAWHLTKGKIARN